MLDGVAVTESDFVVADEDGVLFLGPDRRDEVRELAAVIQRTETAQADRMRAGGELCEPSSISRRYRARQAADPGYSLRDHLREHGGAIEV